MENEFNQMGTDLLKFFMVFLIYIIPSPLAAYPKTISHRGVHQVLKYDADMKWDTCTAKLLEKRDNIK